MYSEVSCQFSSSFYVITDQLRPPDRQYERPYRQCITDVFKGMGAGISVAGTIQAGCVQPGDKVCVMPQGEIANVRSKSLQIFVTNKGVTCKNITTVYLCSLQ